VNKEIAEWLGFEDYVETDKWNGGYWDKPLIMPSRHIYYNPKTNQQFPIDTDFEHDFNACEKWIIPELAGPQISIYKRTFRQDEWHLSIRLNTKPFVVEGYGKTIPEAFCRAIMSMIWE